MNREMMMKKAPSFEKPSGLSQPSLTLTRSAPSNASEESKGPQRPTFTSSKLQAAKATGESGNEGLAFRAKPPTTQALTTVKPADKKDQPTGELTRNISNTSSLTKSKSESKPAENNLTKSNS